MGAQGSGSQKRRCYRKILCVSRLRASRSAERLALWLAIVKSVSNQFGGYRVHGADGTRRPGFTLTELVVSIGILALMMTMVGTVFRVTTKSTGEAKAVMDVTRWLNLLERTLRDDLAAVNPGRSMMIIQANPVNTYWRTRDAELDARASGGDDKPETGYPHNPDPEREVYDDDTDTFRMDRPRADVLMFFTSREQRSAVYPRIWSTSAQVVYAHAEIGDLDKDGAWTPPAGPLHPFPAPFAAPLYPVPAEQWHLARRCVLLVDAPESSLYGLIDEPSMTGPDDVPCDINDADYDAFFGKTRPLRDGRVDLIDADPDPNFFEGQVVDRINASGLDEWINRSWLDLQPPPQVATRLGQYFIPRCASFKVEWALDLRKFIVFDPTVGDPPPDRIIWLDPGRVDVNLDPQPLGELNALSDEYPPSSSVKTALVALRDDLSARFAPGTGIDTQTPVWYANDRPNSGHAGDPDRFFPVALRVTVDVYDESSRLERPIRHVMVLPVGTQ